MAGFNTLPLLAALAERGGSVTLDVLAEVTGLPRRRAADTLRILTRRQLIASPQQHVYELLDAGREALETAEPVRCGPKKCRPLNARRVRDTLRQRLWAALRMAGKATLADLLRRAYREGQTGSTKNALHYLRALEHIGAVRKLEWKQPGNSPNSRGFVRWMLLNDFGPLAPIPSLKKGFVLDPNSGERLPLAQEASHE